MGENFAALKNEKWGEIPPLGTNIEWPYLTHGFIDGHSSTKNPYLETHLFEIVEIWKLNSVFYLHTRQKLEPRIHKLRVFENIFLKLLWTISMLLDIRSSF